MERAAAQPWRGLGWLSLPAVGAVSCLVGNPLAELAGPTGGAGGALAALTLTFALAAVGNLVLRGVGEHRPRRRFVLLWAGAGGAALLTTAALVCGRLVAKGTVPPGAAALAGWQAAPVALQWTLTWGLAAAGLTAALGPVRPVAALGPALYARVGVAALLLGATITAAGALVAVPALAGNPGQRPAPVPPTARPTPAVPTPTAEPSDPALLTNPDPEPGHRGRCEPSVVALTYRFADAALGARYGVLTATNTGSRPCSLKGYPDLAFADVEGNNVRVRLAHGRWNGQGEKVRRIVLAPGAKARAELSWRADAGAYDRAVRLMLAAPFAGAERTACSDRFELVNGSSVRLSPWLPTR